MQSKANNCPNLEEVLDRYTKTRRQVMAALALNKACSVDITKRRLLNEVFIASKKTSERRTTDLAQDLSVAGETESKRDLRLVKSHDQSTALAVSKSSPISITFITDELIASGAFETLMELAKQMFFLGMSTTVIARIPPPFFMPPEMDYRQVGLGGDPLILIPESAIVVCGTYSMLRAIKTTFDVPLVYFASEEDYLDPQLDIKDKLLMISALSCADLTMCFNNHVYKQLLQEYGLNVVLVPSGIDVKTFPRSNRNLLHFKEVENQTDVYSENTQGGQTDSDDNFWHMQRNSFYRKNGVFGKERFDFSYHFMMREPNESLMEENIDYEETNPSFAKDRMSDGKKDIPEVLTDFEAKKLLFVLERESDLSSIDLVNKVAELLLSVETNIEIVAAVKEDISSLSERILVRHVSSLEELAALYTDAWLYVSVERGSNFARYALMAMAAGVPVVSSDHYGIVDFARHGDNAMLAPVADAKSSVDLIKRVMGDETLAARLRKGGLETAAFYDWERLREQYINIFHTLADVYGTAEVRDTLPEPLVMGKKQIDFTTEETATGKYKIKSFPSGDRLKLNLGSLELNHRDADLLAEKLSRGDFYALTIPVTRKVVGLIRNTSWEIVAVNEEVKEKYNGRLTKFYLSDYASSDLLPKQIHPGVMALAKGDYLQAVSLLQGDENKARHNAVMLRWMIVAFMGLGRFDDAYDMALSGCRSYIFNPDFYLLAYHSAKQAGMTLDFQELKRELQIIGPGMKFPEWFADPLSLLEADQLLGV